MFGFASASKFQEHMRGLRERPVDELTLWPRPVEEPAEDQVHRLQVQIIVLQQTLAAVMDQLEQAERRR